MLKITTDRCKVPWGWILLLSIPVGVFAYIEKCSGTALTFTLRKYTSDPTLIAFIGSINKIFGVLIAPYAAYMSDFSNGRFSSRKLLIVIGLLIVAISLFVLPNCNSLLMTIVVVLFLQASVDFGYTGPWKPLYFSIVPKPQRGKSMVINRYCSIAMRFIFMFFLIGSFDTKIGSMIPKKALVKKFFGSITGEHMIYYLGAIGVLFSLLIIVFLVKDNQNSATSRKRFKIKDYINYFWNNNEARLVCLLVLCYTLMSTKLITLRPLLITEQFGYSKQIMGNVHSVTMLVNTLLILPLMLILIDRVDRFKLFAVCIILSTLHPIVYWFYVKFFSPMQIPSPEAIIAFNVADSVFDRTAFLVLWPIVFDFTDPDKKGLINSGVLIVVGVISFLNINLMGLVVKGYSYFFAPEGSYDYMSTYLYIFAVGIIGLYGTIIFARKRKSSSLSQGKLSLVK